MIAFKSSQSSFLAFKNPISKSKEEKIKYVLYMALIRQSPWPCHSPYRCRCSSLPCWTRLLLHPKGQISNANESPYSLPRSRHPTVSQIGRRRVMHKSVKGSRTIIIRHFIRIAFLRRRWRVVWWGLFARRGLTAFDLVRIQLEDLPLAVCQTPKVRDVRRMMSAHDVGVMIGGNGAKV
jgi:hypothetical protein